MIAEGVRGRPHRAPVVRWRAGGWLRRLRNTAALCFATGVLSMASAQMAEFGGGAGNQVGPHERTVSEWLMRIQQGARVPSYIGTFVVTSVGGAMSSARIWHVCEGDVQMERVETLSGALRTTFRRNDAVVTFLPATRTVRAEQREVANVFPNLFAAGADGATADSYLARQIGEGRVAGFDADIVQFTPRDILRFGYRIWSEKRTGLVIKTQTLDNTARVLEQSAFSELQLDAPVKVAALQRMMTSTSGYRVERSDRVRTTADAEGWALKSVVPGFKPQGFYRQTSTTGSTVTQWIFSDGLATVSLFMEPFDVERHAREGAAALGATHTMARRVSLGTSDWWVTGVGEVPLATLRTFVESLERRK